MALQVLLELRDPFAEFRDLHQARDLLAHRFVIEGFGHIVFGAAFDGVHRGLDGSIAGHDDYR